LIGAAAPEEDRQRVHEAIASFEEVNEILRLLTMHLA
jgi:divalent metal cation (Fe/Co/Zn/Cd) transporter